MERVLQVHYKGIIMKVFMMTDLEGVAGVVSFEDQAYEDGKYYEESKRLLTGEVNAAVEGLLEAGVDEIIVRDGHGAGGINFEMLHPAVKLIHGQTWGLKEQMLAIMRSCDVGIMIGQHAMAGVADGNLNHTQNSREITEYRLNGKPIGEIAQFAYEMGALGLPVIYLSGDSAACREAEELIPGIITTSVKEGIARNAALCLSATVAREKICNDVKNAIEKQNEQKLAPLMLSGPYCMDITCTNTTSTDMRSAAPHCKRISDLTFRVESDNILDVLYG